MFSSLIIKQFIHSLVTYSQFKGDLMHKYIMIESKSHIGQHEPMIVSLFSEFIDIDQVEKKDNQLWIYFDHDIELSLKDVIINLSQDTLVDFRLYESYKYMTKEDLDKHAKFIEDKLKQINFNLYNYLDDHVILLHFIQHLDQSFKTYVFGKFNHDLIMLETVQTFLENNQNVGLAAKALYVHRNTLTQRLDKFYQFTGFDLRRFMDGFIIYHLLLSK